MFQAKFTVEELRDFPQQSTGAPIPLVLADEQHVVLSYLLEEQTGFAFVEFRGVGWHSMGGPNDETLHGHPLYAKGLRHYSVFETKPSPQIERLRKIASVHRMYNEANFKSLRHLMFTFHDSL